MPTQTEQNHPLGPDELNAACTEEDLETNPMHPYSEVNPIILNGAYSLVNMDRLATWYVFIGPWDRQRLHLICAWVKSGRDKIHFVHFFFPLGHWSKTRKVGYHFGFFLFLLHYCHNSKGDCSRLGLFQMHTKGMLCIQIKWKVWLQHAHGDNHMPRKLINGPELALTSCWMIAHWQPWVFPGSQWKGHGLKAQDASVVIKLSWAGPVSAGWIPIYTSPKTLASVL